MTDHRLTVVAIERERVESTHRQMVLSVWRCPTCGRILAKVRLTPGSVVQVKCGVCNTMATKEAA